MKCLLCILIALICTFNGQILADSSRPQILFTCPAPIDSPEFKVLHLIYSDFFDRQNLDFSMITTTEKRTIYAVLEGQADGLCGKSLDSLGRINSNKLFYPEAPIGELHITALAHPQTEKINSLDQLTSTQLRIGIVGETAAARHAKLHKVRYSSILTVQRGIRMLAAKRLDAVISNRLQMQRNINDIQPQSPLQFSDTLYIEYVHPALHTRHLPLKKALTDYLTSLTQCMNGPWSYQSTPQWQLLLTQNNHPCLNPP